jgi:pimeloyl-ACP methyl ester carboxylesterase
MYVPEAWNGSLVLYAHGYNSSDEPLTLDDENLAEIRNGLNELGYAVAYSSWSENGWAVLDGIQRTHQLVGLFTARFETPARVYLIGRSLGSLVVTSLAESHPEQYDGVLPVCAFLGGGQAFADYISNIRLLFNLYYPGVLPGDPLGSPPLGAGTMLGLAKTAMKADIAGAGHIADAMVVIGMPVPVVPGQPATLIGSILTALGYFLAGRDALVARTHGQFPFDNWNTDYVIPEVQAGIPRFAGHPAAMNYIQRAYQPTGRLRMPMVALENAFDPVAAGFHRDRYEQLLGETGAADLFARITLPSYDHCPDTAGPTISAFQELVTWVETGIRP